MFLLSIYSISNFYMRQSSFRLSTISSNYLFSDTLLSPYSSSLYSSHTSYSTMFLNLYTNSHLYQLSLSLSFLLFLRAHTECCTLLLSTHPFPSTLTLLCPIFVLLCTECSLFYETSISSSPLRYTPSLPSLLYICFHFPFFLSFTLLSLIITLLSLFYTQLYLPFPPLFISLYLMLFHPSSTYNPSLPNLAVIMNFCISSLPYCFTIHVS